jgi:hypothetical protein
MDSEVLLPLKFRDCPVPTRFRSNGKGHLIAGMQILQRLAFLHLELFGRAAGIRSHRAVLRLFDRDGVIEPVNSGDCARLRLLGQSPRTEDGEGRNASRKDLCDLHGSLPVCEMMRDKLRGAGLVPGRTCLRRVPKVNVKEPLLLLYAISALTPIRAANEPRLAVAAQFAAAKKGRRGRSVAGAARLPSRYQQTGYGCSSLRASVSMSRRRTIAKRR